MRRHLDLGDDDCPLSVAELGELSWGPAAYGSLFQTREELREAWDLGRDYLMKHWEGSGRRAAAFYEFEWQGAPPDYDRERSTLWRANMLVPAERTVIEREWFEEFEVAYTRGFDATRRRQHLDWADVPLELRKRWRAQRRRGAKAIKQLAVEASESEPPAAPVPPT
jgi:hypothetical protein